MRFEEQEQSNQQSTEQVGSKIEPRPLPKNLTTSEQAWLGVQLTFTNPKVWYVFVIIGILAFERRAEFLFVLAIYLIQQLDKNLKH